MSVYKWGNWVAQRLRNKHVPGHRTTGTVGPEFKPRTIHPAHWAFPQSVPYNQWQQHTTDNTSKTPSNPTIRVHLQGILVVPKWCYLSFNPRTCRCSLNSKTGPLQIKHLKMGGLPHGTLLGSMSSDKRSMVRREDTGEGNVTWSLWLSQAWSRMTHTISQRIPRATGAEGDTEGSSPQICLPEHQENEALWQQITWHVHRLR